MEEIRSGGLASQSHGMRKGGGTMSGPIGKSIFWGTIEEGWLNSRREGRMKRNPCSWRKFSSVLSGCDKWLP
jgi:hypothetical protein